VNREETVRMVYRAFNEGDVETVLTRMHPEVDWPNAWEGGRVIGREAVRDYWTRQFREIRSTVEPESFRAEPDGSLTGLVHQVVYGASSNNAISDSRGRHRFWFDEDGLVTRMDVLEE
jgi:ketosteroid isomerase-like protein